MAYISAENGKLILQRRDDLTVIEGWGPDCIRVRSTRNSKLLDEDWTLLKPTEAAECESSFDGKEAWLHNGRIAARIETDVSWVGERLSFYRDGVQILRSRYEGDYQARNLHTGGDMYEVKVIFDANPGEHLYGLGQEQEDFFDRKGSTVNLCHYNTKSAVPVVHSSLGYGFLWNNPAPGHVETTNNHTMWVADSAYGADYLVYAAETPAGLLKRNAGLTGFAPKFPYWASGFWQSRLRYEDQETALSVAREYKRRGIPISALVIDFFHWTEQGEWKFEPSLWPDPEGMIRELREMGIEPIVSIWPTINPKSENYREMDDRGMLVRTENGQYGIFDFHGMQTYVDVTNPATGPFVWERVKKNYYDKGVRSFWLDEAEPDFHPIQYANLHFYAGNGAQTALLYPFYYEKMFYEALRGEGEEEPIFLSRAAYLGSQRFGALVWNGDVPSTFEALRMSVKAGLSMAMSGIPWWNSDIGGFHDGDTRTEYFRELIVRWAQFGLFCPVMRLHGVRARTPDTPPIRDGVLEATGGDNEIWSFGERDYAILRQLVELRERLRPYIMENMELAHREAMPIMRPLFLEYPEDGETWKLEDEYMFGGDIIFAPITEQGAVKRSVYLPEGRWVDVWTGEVLSGGWTEREAPIERFIAFTKEGSGVAEAFSALRS